MQIGVVRLDLIYAWRSYYSQDSEQDQPAVWFQYFAVEVKITEPRGLESDPVRFRILSGCLNQ
jgi:hypothetical protein